MTKNMKNISISGIAILIVFSFGLLLNAGQSDIPEPEMLQESYLQGSREEKSQQCSKEVASALGEECLTCSFCLTSGSPPLSPFDNTSMYTLCPFSLYFSKVPPHPNSISSGWEPMASMFMVSPSSRYSYIYNFSKIYTTCFTLATKKYIILR